MKIERSFSVAFWNDMSLVHLQLADKLTDCIQNLEENRVPGEFNSMEATDSHAYAVGVVMSSVAYLESNINELFEKNSDGFQAKINKLNQLEESIDKCKNWWGNDKNKRSTVIHKYNTFLKLNNKSKISSKSLLFKDINNLIFLRNQLMHYTPEWVSRENEEGKGVHIAISEKFEGKFPISKFYENSNNPFYPDKLLGYGSSKWILNQVCDFSKEFYRKFEVEAPYARRLEIYSQISQ